MFFMYKMAVSCIKYKNIARILNVYLFMCIYLFFL